MISVFAKDEVRVSERFFVSREKSVNMINGNLVWLVIYRFGKYCLIGNAIVTEVFLNQAIKIEGNY
jgi:hypothetical protein